MAGIKETTANLLEYAGIRSKDYYHSTTEPAYDPDDLTAYYLNQRRRSHYTGPLDSEGIPLYVYQGNADYLPVLIGFYALGNLENYRRDRSEENLETFLTIADWFCSSQQSDGTWRSNFPMPRFGLKPGFPSAMVQGVAISCLVRAFKMTGSDKYPGPAVRALTPFHIDVRDGGVTSHEDGKPFYEEYPLDPPHHVFNGFLYAMWGLLDLVRLDGNAEAKKLYYRGLTTFIDWLPRYDIGYWSLYHISEGTLNPATIHYQRLHVDQLEVMHALTGNELFGEYRDRWQGYLNGRFNALRTLPAKLRWRLFGS